MGIPGAGKSRDRRGVRRPRLCRGSTATSAAARCATSPGRSTTSSRRGRAQIVLDNTYLTRASRSHVVEAAGRHGVAARCVWIDTPLAQAQVNLVERLLDRFGSLPTPEELKELARREPGVLAPTSQMRALRELEPPSTDEGFARVEQVPFVRAQWPRTRAGVFVAAAASEAAPAGRTRSAAPTRAPHLVFDWSPGGRRMRSLAAAQPWHARSPDRWRAPSARIPPARRSAGAGRRFRG